RKYKLPMSYIIPFPKKGDPSSAQDFGQGRQVLAVYPGTTALYRATVASQRKRKSDEYVTYTSTTFYDVQSYLCKLHIFHFGSVYFYVYLEILIS
uniref:SGF29 C-terminal domain-containing protein n=1 Tax=Aegilops tauschii subsp. strangulata TaxID=200361 RepID=A0A453K620_AEGTS